MAFLLAPNSSVGRLMNNPTVKFMNWLVSEIVFVLILLINTILSQGNITYGLDRVSYPELVPNRTYRKSAYTFVFESLSSILIFLTD